MGAVTVGAITVSAMTVGAATLGAMTTVVLAHHAIIAAIPFVVPTLIITLTVVVMAVRDRRRDEHDQPSRAQSEDQRPE